jgi:hypothetical protein
MAAANAREEFIMSGLLEEASLNEKPKLFGPSQGLSHQSRNAGRSGIRSVGTRPNRSMHGCCDKLFPDQSWKSNL